MGMAGDSDGIITLVKEAASDFGQLVADHIRLARVEMTADAKSYARDVATLLVGAFILAAGYGLACIAGNRGHRPPSPFSISLATGCPVASLSRLPCLKLTQPCDPSLRPSRR